MVGGGSISVSLVLTGGAAHCGSVGWRGGGGHGVGTTAGGGRDTLLLFGLLTGKLGDAEDELEAAQFDVAAVVEERRALPACPTAPNQAGTARLTAA